MDASLCWQAPVIQSQLNSAKKSYRWHAADSELDQQGDTEGLEFLFHFSFIMIISLLGSSNIIIFGYLSIIEEADAGKTNEPE